ncbi:hypothetical protein G6F59_015694 [Rhizopus arrhizus]|nr:hypothetical protein G6F59_015694 [Rhizopus arrhizus]
MNRYSMPICRPNGLGFTKRCMSAYSQPEAQACSAAMMKITMRERAVSTPIDSAITRPPLSARMARPSRESSRVIDAAALVLRPAEQVVGGDVRDAGVAAQAFDGAEGEIQRQAPGNGAQRQEVARQLERDGAQQPGDEERQHQSGQQGQPGGGAQPGQPGRQGVGAGGEQRRGVGAHAHEGGLSEAGHN